MNSNSKEGNMVKSVRYKIIILSLMLIIFLGIGFVVMGKSEGIFFDNIILEYLQDRMNPMLLEVMKFISFIGSYVFIAPVMAIIFIYNYIKKRYYIAKLLLLSTGGAWILNFILKQIFRRIRPIEYFLVEQSDFSYPSGHTMVATTFYLTTAFLLTRNIKDKRKRILCYFTAATLIFLMGISRLYLGVHWPTDVLGGFLIGYIFFSLSVTLSK